MDIYAFIIEILSYLAKTVFNGFIKLMEFIFNHLGLAGLAGFLIAVYLHKFSNTIKIWAYFIIFCLILIIILVGLLDFNIFDWTLPSAQANQWVDLK